MYKLLLGLMAFAVLEQLGISIADFKDCHSRQCLRKIEKASLDVLKIDWKPVSVFPEEARRFR